MKYALSKLDRLALLAATQKLVDDPRRDAHEQAVQESLPVLEGLENASSDTERQAVYTTVIQAQRSAFIDTHGSAFGEESAETPHRTATIVRAKQVLAA